MLVLHSQTGGPLYKLQEPTHQKIDKAIEKKKEERFSFPLILEFINHLT